MRVLIATDAWRPQVNGVVTTLSRTAETLGSMGHQIEVVHPGDFRSFPCPTYPEIRLAIAPGPRVCRMIEEFEPDAVHIETEAPLGMAARRHCIASGYPFTTAYHTQFPEFVHARCRLPLGVTYRAMRWFHDPAGAVMVPTAEMRRRLDPLAEPSRVFRHTARELLALAAWRVSDAGAARRYIDMIATDAETPPGTRARIDVLSALMIAAGKS